MAVADLVRKGTRNPRWYEQASLLLSGSAEILSRGTDANSMVIFLGKALVTCDHSAS